MVGNGLRAVSGLSFLMLAWLGSCGLVGCSAHSELTIHQIEWKVGGSATWPEFLAGDAPEASDPGNEATDASETGNGG